ncbi:MAG: potassium channel family protein [Actinomycetota bacterium]|nr:potassium channel family protein [Actinomycetota bacterium]
MAVRSDNPFSRLRWPGLGLMLTGVYGVAGYMLIERWSFIDALYMTMLALTSVGFEEARPLSLAGEWFTISLLGLGVGIFVVTLSLIGVAISEGAFGQRTIRRRMQRRISALRDHYIVCAYGRVGRTAARELAEEGVPFVVLEPKEELVEMMEDDDILFLMGDSTSDEALRAAGIERARALLCAVDSDAENVYVALAARSLNPDIFIVGRASDPTAATRLHKAGADRVISIYATTGQHMAAMALRPGVVDYLELSRRGGSPMRIEELQVDPGSELSGRSIAEVCGTTVPLAVLRSGGDIVANPNGDLLLEDGDLLMLLGEEDALRRLEEPRA